MPYDPPQLLSDAWARLRAGRDDAGHAFRTAAVATADALGRADVRTVVLRRVDEAGRCLDFQTDRRSPKFDALRHNATAAWLFYDAAEQLQLRIQTAVTLHATDTVADEQWADVPEKMRTPYRLALMSGAAIDGPDAPPPRAGSDGRENFVVVRGRVESLEWLRRDDGVWRRVRFTWPAATVAWQWLIP